MVLFFAIAVHAFDQHPSPNNQQEAFDVSAVLPSPVLPSTDFAPGKSQDGLRDDAVLAGGEAESLEAHLEEGKQRAALPKPRGMRSMAVGLLLVLALLVYGAVSTANERVGNNLFALLKSPEETLATKAYAIKSHLMHPGAHTPYSTLSLIIYAAAWGLFLSGFSEFMRTKRFIAKFKKMQNDSAAVPEMFPDVRARTLVAIGTAMMLLASLGLLLNVHTLFYFYVDVGFGFFGAGVMLLLAKLLEGNRDVRQILFPEWKEKSKAQTPNPEPPTSKP